jgi:hypothetical protein
LRRTRRTILRDVLIHDVRSSDAGDAVSQRSHDGPTSREPERFVRGAPVAAAPPTEVWINKPKAQVTAPPKGPAAVAPAPSSEEALQ